MVYLINFLWITILSITALFMDNNIDYNGLGILLFVYISGISSMINIGVFLYKADTIWSLFDVLQTNFLKSRTYCKYISTVYEYQKKSIKLSKIIFRFFTMIYFLWMFYPIVLNTFSVLKNQNQNRCYENIFNMKFPVSTSTYNRYYFVFYLAEIAIETFIYISTTIVIIFFITFYLAIVAQYEIIIRAFEDLGQEDNCETFLNSKSMI